MSLGRSGVLTLRPSGKGYRSLTEIRSLITILSLSTLKTQKPLTPSQSCSGNRSITRTKKTKWVYYPKQVRKRVKGKVCLGVGSVNPRFPVYVISKGRADISPGFSTFSHLERIGIPYSVVVEEQERDDYAAATQGNILILDPAFKEHYDTCDNLGLSKSTGPGPARNFVWEHARAAGAEWYWILDDNIKGWRRLSKNDHIPIGDGTMWRVLEDFCLRYENLAIAGPAYYFFTPRRAKHPPFTLNTRVMSHLLIRADLPFKWRGRYNEDIILSLDVLNAGWCTVEFRTMVQVKATTQLVPGGNTDDLYRDGTRAKTEMLLRVHPRDTKIVTRYGRTHHRVNYSRFKYRKLVRKPDLQIKPGIDNYGMRIEKA